MIELRARVISRNLKTGGVERFLGGVGEKFARSVKFFFTPPDGVSLHHPNGVSFLTGRTPQRGVISQLYRCSSVYASPTRCVDIAMHICIHTHFCPPQAKIF